MRDTQFGAFACALQPSLFWAEPLQVAGGLRPRLEKKTV